MGGKPKDALRFFNRWHWRNSTTRQVPRASNVSPDATTSLSSQLANKTGGTSSVEAVKNVVEPTTMSAKLLQGLGMKGDNTLFKLLNNPVGEGVAYGLMAQLLASMTDEEEDERTAFERRPFGFVVLWSNRWSTHNICCYG